MIAELEDKLHGHLGRDEICSLGQKRNGEAVHVEFHSRLISRTFIATVSASNSTLLYRTGFNARRGSSRLRKCGVRQLFEKLVEGLPGPRLALQCFLFLTENCSLPPVIAGRPLR
jgi:hypothetical protein